MYSIWRLSDLSSLSIVLTLFLFGDAHKEHWTMPLGYIIAILNPDLSTTEKQVHDGYIHSINITTYIHIMWVNLIHQVYK